MPLLKKTTYSLFRQLLKSCAPSQRQMRFAVYYTIFVSPGGAACCEEFIAISNSPFEYQKTYGIAKVRFLQHYDMAKQIVLPYDNQTIKLLDIQKWHKVN